MGPATASHESYWAGVHVPSTGITATAPVSEDDLRRLGMWDHVDRLPLTSPEYSELPEEARDRVSSDEDIAIQPYSDFVQRYEENVEELTPVVDVFLPENVVRRHFQENYSIAAKYMTEEGLNSREGWEDIPNRAAIGEHVEREAFVEDATVLYAQTLEDLEEADPHLAIINLKAGRALQHLRGIKDNTGDIEGWLDAQQRTIDQLESIAETLEEASFEES